MTLAPENVEDYPRPPRLEAVPQRLRVVLGSATVADTGRGLRVLETWHAPTYYLPPDDVAAHLVAAGRGSFCEWKGRARYFDVEAGGRRVARAAWCYDAPTAAFAALAGHLAFYAATMDEVWVGEVRAAPQPGGFYGGWLTPNLTGRIKGAPGTEWW